MQSYTFCTLHDQPLTYICINQECQQCAAICNKCIGEHNNHSDQDFLEIPNMQNYLKEYADFIDFIFQQTQNFKDYIQPIYQQMKQIISYTKYPKKVNNLFNNARLFLRKDQQGNEFISELLQSLDEINQQFNYISSTITNLRMPNLQRCQTQSGSLPNIYRSSQKIRTESISDIKQSKKETIFFASGKQQQYDDNQEQQLEKAQRLLKEQKYKSAYQIADNVLKNYPNSGKAYFIKAECRFRSSMFQEAIEICEKGLQYDDKNSQLAFQVLLKLSNYNESMNFVDKVLEKYESYWRTLYVKAQVLYYKKEYKRAQDCCEKILQLNQSANIKELQKNIQKNLHYQREQNNSFC